MGTKPPRGPRAAFYAAHRSCLAPFTSSRDLDALTKKALAAAKSGDSAGAQAAVKEFIKAGEIRELDTVAGGNFNPKQRRNPGAPPTAEIEAQMGTEAYALYEAGGKGGVTGKGYKLAK